MALPSSHVTWSSEGPRVLAPKVGEQSFALEATALLRGVVHSCRWCPSCPGLIQFGVDVSGTFRQWTESRFFRSAGSIRWL